MENYPDQQIFFLFFVLHPPFCKVGIQMLERSEKLYGNWQHSHNFLSYFRFMHAAEFYFEKFRLYEHQTIQDYNKRDWKEE